MQYGKYISTLIVLIVAVNAFAQPSDKLAGYGIEVNPVFGKILKHNYVFPPVPNSSYALDVCILKRTTGKKAWQTQRNYPLVGLGITYTDYGIDSIYGKCIGLYPVWEIPIISGEQLEWTCRFGYGIGYMTKRFERYPSDNTINNLIGSRLNNFTMFTTQLRYKLSHKVHVHAGFNFTHVSNGSFRLPNLGVNMYGGHVGVRYFPVTDDPQRTSIQAGRLPNKFGAQLRAGIGFVEYNNVDGPSYPVYAATALGYWRYGGKNKVLFGVDYNYYTSVYSFLKNNEIEVGNEKAKSWEGVIFIGHEFLIGRFGVIAQFGIPFKHPEFNQDKTVQKLGYSYYLLQKEKGIIRNVALNCFIKSNNLEASNLEFGLGVGL